MNILNNHIQINTYPTNLLCGKESVIEIRLNNEEMKILNIYITYQNNKIIGHINSDDFSYIKLFHEDNIIPIDIIFPRSGIFFAYIEFTLNKESFIEKFEISVSEDLSNKTYEDFEPDIYFKIIKQSNETCKISF